MSGAGPGSLATTERLEPRDARCPRCQSPIEGDYKFCPTCAFRLRTGVLEPAPAAPASPLRRGQRLWAGVLGASAVLSLGALGLLLFRPDLFDRPRTSTPHSTPVTDRVHPRPFTIDDIPDQLVSLERGGYAYSVPLAEVPGLSDDDIARIESSLRSDGAEHVGEPSLDAIVYYPLKILRTEVTCGQFEEFLRDVDEHRDRMPEIWLRWERVESPTDVDILAHVPPAWVRRPANGLVEWSVEETAKNLPVSQVSYVDALAFCEWAGKHLGLAIGLPFAMEWIRAARPPAVPRDAPAIWPWGETKLLYACNSLTYWLPNPGRPQIVDFPYSEGTGGAADGGILCMAGNVREWAAEHSLKLVPHILDEPPTLTWEETPNARTAIAFGGSFRTGIDDCQIDSRTTYLKTERRDDVGFRIVVR